MLNFHENTSYLQSTFKKDKLLSVIAENVPYAILPVDINGKVIYWNRAAERIFGYTAKEIVGEPLTKIMPKGFELKIKGTKAAIKSPLGYGNFETIGIRKDGSKLPLEFSYSMLETKKGVLLVIIARDVRKQKEKERKIKGQMESLKGLLELTVKELKQAQAKLLQSERMAAIGELAGMVAHDLRNPLMGIAGAAYYLKTHAHSKLDDTERRMLKIIEENVAYSNKILSDLQDYSKEVKLELKETSVKALLKDGLSSLTVPSNIQVIDKTKDCHRLMADVNKMKRVFINIIKNAVEAMPKGGKLTVISKRKKDKIEISFSDTGIGIPPDVLAKVGKPLVTTKAKGMGFGLAICNRIIEAHKGKLSIESEPSKGTTVKIKLPIAQNSKSLNQVHILQAECMENSQFL